MGVKKILIVDDEEDFLKVTEMNLASTGDYTIKTMSDPTDIISVIHSFKPDVILLDLLMPNTGGIDACEMLNKDPMGSKTPVIILSALEKDVDKLKAFKLGVVDYLTKPIQIDKLKSVIAKALKFL